MPDTLFAVNTWGWPNKLMGDADTHFKYWTFKNVRIKALK